eukprot:12367676-Prorocentrum_lima.AAC.1
MQDVVPSVPNPRPIDTARPLLLPEVGLPIAFALVKVSQLHRRIRMGEQAHVADGQRLHEVPHAPADPG